MRSKKIIWGVVTGLLALTLVACGSGGQSNVKKEYDDAGNLIKTTHYNEDGAIYYVSEYNADEVEIKTTWYREDGTIDRVYEYYDEGYHVDKLTTHYNEDGTISSVTEFDTEGEEIKKQEYEYDYETGVLTCEKEYEADDVSIDLALVKETYFYASGSPAQYIEYANDLWGNILKDVSYYENGNMQLSLEYENGDLVKKTTYNENGNIVSCEEKIAGEKLVSTYDENGVLDYAEKFSNSTMPYEHLEYDSNGDLEWRTVKEGDEMYGWTSKTKYDANDNVLEYVKNQWKAFKYTDSGITKYVAIKSTTYDGNGNVVSWEETQCDENGNLEKWTKYDANGNVLDSEIYDKDGNVIG